MYRFVFCPWKHENPTLKNKAHLRCFEHSICISLVVGIICPPVGIGLTDLPKNGREKLPPCPFSNYGPGLSWDGWTHCSQQPLSERMLSVQWYTIRAKPLWSQFEFHEIFTNMEEWRLKVKRMKKVSWPAKTTDDCAILIDIVSKNIQYWKKYHKENSKKSDRE